MTDCSLLAWIGFSFFPYILNWSPSLLSHAVSFLTYIICSRQGKFLDYQQSTEYYSKEGALKDVEHL